MYEIQATGHPTFPHTFESHKDPRLPRRVCGFGLSDSADPRLEDESSSACQIPRLKADAAATASDQSHTAGEGILQGGFTA